MGKALALVVALILAVTLLFAHLLGDWHRGYHVVQWIAIAIAGVSFVWLALAAAVEWRQQQAGRRSTRDADAESWVAAEIARWRTASYAELVEREGQALHKEVVDSNGKAWVGETQFFWDDAEKQNLRVMVDIFEPGRLVHRSRVVEDFIRAPDGTFVDE